MVRKHFFVCSAGAPPPFAISDIRSGRAHAEKKKKKTAFHSPWNLLLKCQGTFGQLRVIHKSQNEPADWSDRPGRLSLGSTPGETTLGQEALQRLDCCLSAWSAGSECLSSGSVSKRRKEGGRKGKGIPRSESLVLNTAVVLGSPKIILSVSARVTN